MHLYPSTIPTFVSISPHPNQKDQSHDVCPQHTADSSKEGNHSRMGIQTGVDLKTDSELRLVGRLGHTEAFNLN